MEEVISSEFWKETQEMVDGVIEVYILFSIHQNYQSFCPYTKYSFFK